VSDMPERPYVPRLTPQASRQVVIKSEFALSRPFVPGTGEAIPPIANFLVVESYVESLASTTFAEYESYDPLAADELPPVEHFIDPLPAVTAFAPDAGATLLGTSQLSDDVVLTAGEQGEVAGTDWIQEEWQQFDWRAAAALGDGVETEASNEWATTDWEVSPPAAREKKQSAAEAIASALDQIAQRIREGELSLPSPSTLTDPSAIAASLAALLGGKR
jgi:hypothetical protein